MKAHAMTWEQIADMMGALHIRFEVDTHRPTMVVFFYPHVDEAGEQGWAGGVILDGEFHALSTRAATIIKAALARDEPDEGMAEA